MKNKISQEEFNNNKFNAKYIKIIPQKNVCDLIYLGHKPKNSVKRINKTQYVKYRKVKKPTYADVNIYKQTDGTVVKYENWHTEEVIETDGKVYEYMSKSGERNVRSLRKIFNDMRYLMNNNFVQQDTEKQLFITLTYKENMQDDKRLYDDFRKFMMRLQHGYKNQHEFGYIVVMEPQGRGAWHCHLLLKSMNQPFLAIPWCHLKRVWGHGEIRIERLKHCDNLGSYFVAYMSGLEVDANKIEELEIDPADVEIKGGKRFVKGERLKFYPDYMKIYRNSKNMAKPDKIKLSAYSEAVDIAEQEYPRITYQTIREIETPNKTLKVSKEQRRKLRT